MRFQIETAALKPALDRVRGIAVRGSIPILGNVLIEAEGNRVHIVATDQTIEAGTSVEAYVPSPGKITVRADQLAEICARLPEGAEIDFEVGNDQRAAVKAGKSRFQLPSLPATDFPRMRPPDVAQRLAMKSIDMNRLFTIGSLCAQELKGRPYLSCGRLLTAGDELRMVSTDGKAMVLVKEPRPDGFALEDGVSISIPTMGVIMKALGAMKAEDEATLMVGETLIAADFGSVQLLSKIIDGAYASYERVIEGQHKHDKLTVDADLLIAALRRVTIADYYAMLDLHEDHMDISARNFVTCEMTDQLACEWTGADGRHISLDARFLLEFLEYVQTESVVLSVPGALDPIRVTETGKPSWVGVIMPTKDSQ